MKDSEIRTKLKEGWLRCIITFEVAGKPKDHVEKSLGQFLSNIKKDERLNIIEEVTEEAIEHEDGIFSAFSEAELLVKDLETFNWLCVNFSPASIEVLEPDELRIEAREVTNYLNDLLSKLHEISSDYREQKGGKEQLVVAMNQLIQNAVLLALRGDERTEEQLMQDTGIAGVQLKPFLDKLIEKGVIVQVGKKYGLAK